MQSAPASLGQYLDDFSGLLKKVDPKGVDTLVDLLTGGVPGCSESYPEAFSPQQVTVKVGSKGGTVRIMNPDSTTSVA